MKLKNRIKQFLRPGPRWTTEDVLYCVFWIMLAALLLGGLFFKLFPDLKKLAGPCAIHELTGLYCPGCGGTRAFLCMIKGDIKGSLFYHPAVFAISFLIGIFLISQTVSRLSKGKLPGMKYHLSYVILLVFIFVLNFIIKNAFLLAEGIALIP